MSKLSYRDAGVDIAQADAFVGRIAALAKSTHTQGVVPHRGEYASLFRPHLTGLQDPLIAATCDGVGTKLLVARQMQSYGGLGQDLVGMNVNDLLPCGATPLLFLDYIATGKLQPEVLAAVVAGMADACRQAGCALLGGETAEMPGVYHGDEFDLAGFAVGLVDGRNLPAAASVKPGDQVLALPATGVHANGFSLVRRALELGGVDLHADMPALGGTVGAALLQPTPIYVGAVRDLTALCPVKVAAHVTGGGLVGRAERMLQPEQRLVLRQARYDVPPIFDVIARAGNIDVAEMRRTFNMGLGYLAVVEADHVDRVLTKLGHTWRHVGEIVAGSTGVLFA